MKYPVHDTQVLTVTISGSFSAARVFGNHLETTFLRETQQTEDVMILN